MVSVIAAHGLMGSERAERKRGAALPEMLPLFWLYWGESQLHPSTPSTLPVQWRGSRGGGVTVELLPCFHHQLLSTYSALARCSV